MSPANGRGDIRTSLALTGGAMAVVQSCAPHREERMVRKPQTQPTCRDAPRVRLGAGPSRLEHVPPPAVDRPPVAGAFVPLSGDGRTTKGGDLALRRGSNGSRALVRLPGIASLERQSRGHAQGQLVALDPRDV